MTIASADRRGADGPTGTMPAESADRALGSAGPMVPSGRLPGLRAAARTLRCPGAQGRLIAFLRIAEAASAGLAQLDETPAAVTQAGGRR